MKKIPRDIICLFVIAVLVAACGQFFYDYKYKPWQERKVNIYYNRDIETSQELVKLIQDADQYVYFAIYTFTKADIRDALLAAKYKGIDVRGVSDISQYKKIDEQRALINELTKAGIPITFQDHDAIMHIKTLVTDKAYFTGSYNWTKSATDSNDEIIEIGYDEDLRQKHLSVLEKLFEKFK